MSTEIEKQTKITVSFDVGSFKWFQIIKVTGTKTQYEREVTVEISPQAAKMILDDLEYDTVVVYPGIDFNIK